MSKTSSCTYRKNGKIIWRRWLIRSDLSSQLVEFFMLKKLIVFAITSGLAAKLVERYIAKQQAKPGASAKPAAARHAAQRYARRAD